MSPLDVSQSISFLIQCPSMDPLSVLRDYATRNLLEDIVIDGNWAVRTAVFSAILCVFLVALLPLWPELDRVCFMCAFSFFCQVITFALAQTIASLAMLRRLTAGEQEIATHSSPFCSLSAMPVSSTLTTCRKRERKTYSSLRSLTGNHCWYVHGESF